MAPFGKFANKFKMLQMHEENYENHANKSLSQCTQYLKCLHNPCDGNIFARYVLQK